MLEAAGLIKTGQITYAVRDTRIDNKGRSTRGDIMGIGDSRHARGRGRERDQVVLDTISAMADEDSEIISVYYGEGVTEEDTWPLWAKLEELYPDCDIEVNEGDSPFTITLYL